MSKAKTCSRAVEHASPTRDEHFPWIDATPEELAKALLRIGPRKPEDREYMKEGRDA